MFGPEHLTVGGYLTEAAIVCRQCGETAKLPADRALSVAELESEFSPDGLTCDWCLGEIVEPSV